MTIEEKWDYIVSLDDELLHGGVVLSEWSTFLVKDADIAFVHSAHLACIITAMAGVETHLRYERDGDARIRFVDLIDDADIEDDLRIELHDIRKYRNRWVHVRKPHIDDHLLAVPEKYEIELQFMAKRAVRALRRVIYSNQML